MYKCYFLLDNILESPHSGITLKLPGASNHTVTLDYMLGHFDDFNYRNFFHTNQIEILDPHAPKFIVSIVHMPTWVDTNLSQDSIDLLKNDPNVYLCLISVLECVLSTKELADELNSKGIPLHKVVVMTSNMQAHGNNIDGVNYICVNFWESISRHHHQTLPNISITTPGQLSINRASKKFLCLNRNIKPHRIWLMYSILRSNVIKQGHVSFNLPSVHRREFEMVSRSHDTLKRIPESLHDDFKRALVRELYNRKLDTLDKYHIINYNSSIKSYYNDSLFSVITESDTSLNFITEKTYKAMMNLHPFFIVGNPDQHALLRTRGYHTFEDLFGVNQVTNYTEALAMWSHIDGKNIDVLKQNIKKKYLDKLIHNQQLFLSRKISWNDITDNLITAVGDD